MEQKTALKELIELCSNFDIGLYTSYDFKEIDIDIISKLRFVKTGKFISKLAIKNKYYGSANQRFIYLKNGRIISEE